MKRIFLGLSLMLLLFPVAASAAEFTDWSAPVNLGPVINSEYVEAGPWISKNGLSLYFSSNRQTGNPSSSNRDLYVANRATINSPWEDPASISQLNSDFNDTTQALSLDEKFLYFGSQRPLGCGFSDLYVSRRYDRSDDLSWKIPVIVDPLRCSGNGVNSPFGELSPTLFEDETGKVILYFISNRTGNIDLYQSEMLGENTFGPVTPVSELNGSSDELSAAVRRDGMEIFFLSNRPDPPVPPTGVHNHSIWRATRARTSDSWSEPVKVMSLNSPGLETAQASGPIAISFDGRELYFASHRGSSWPNLDLWVAKREKLSGNYECLYDCMDKCLDKCK